MSRHKHHDAAAKATTEVAETNAPLVAGSETLSQGLAEAEAAVSAIAESPEATAIPPVEPAAPEAAPAVSAGNDAAGIATEIVKPFDGSTTTAKVEIMAPSGSLRRFSVEIENCLLGKRTFPAESAEMAVEMYMQLGGIIRSQYQTIVKELPATPTE